MAKKEWPCVSLKGACLNLALEQQYKINGRNLMFYEAHREAIDRIIGDLVEDLPFKVADAVAARQLTHAIDVSTFCRSRRDIPPDSASRFQKVVAWRLAVKLGREERMAVDLVSQKIASPRGVRDFTWRVVIDLKQFIIRYDVVQGVESGGR